MQKIKIPTKKRAAINFKVKNDILRQRTMKAHFPHHPNSDTFQVDLKSGNISWETFQID